MSDVLFYAYIYQAVNTGPEILLNHLNEWSLSRSSSSLVVNGARLLVKQNCGVNSTQETVCQRRSSTEGSVGGLPRYVLYVIIGGGAGVLIATLCICCMIIVVCKFHRKAKER